MNKTFLPAVNVINEVNTIIVSFVHRSSVDVIELKHMDLILQDNKDFSASPSQTDICIEIIVYQ